MEDVVIVVLEDSSGHGRECVCVQAGDQWLLFCYMEDLGMVLLDMARTMT